VITCKYCETVSAVEDDVPCCDDATIAALEAENEKLLKFVKDIANHDWELAEMGAAEVWGGAVDLLDELGKGEQR